MMVSVETHRASLMSASGKDDGGFLNGKCGLGLEESFLILLR